MAKKKKGNGIKKTAGRPTAITPDVLAKLEEVFKLDVTVETACRYAGINAATYYRQYKADEDFARRMDKAREFARLAAGQVVMDAIVKDKDTPTARWWLEKKAPKEFAQQPEQLQDNRQINIFTTHEQLAERLGRLFQGALPGADTKESKEPIERGS